MKKFTLSPLLAFDWLVHFIELRKNRQMAEQYIERLVLKRFALEAIDGATQPPSKNKCSLCHCQNLGCSSEAECQRIYEL
jgi:hypothetical protein